MVQLHLLTQLGKFSVTLTVHLFTQNYFTCVATYCLTTLISTMYSTTYCLTALTSTIVFSHLLLDGTYLHYVFNRLLLDGTYLHYCINSLTA